MQRILRWEFGGTGEALANLAKVTGETKYLDAARRFDDDEMLQSAFAGENNLTRKHGNTNVPKFIAAASVFELTGEESYRKAASFFWR